MYVGTCDGLFGDRPEVDTDVPRVRSKALVEINPHTAKQGPDVDLLVSDSAKKSATCRRGMMRVCPALTGYASGMDTDRDVALLTSLA